MDQQTPSHKVQQTKARKMEKGQSFVEVALSIPLLLIILMGLIDLGRMYYVYVALEDAAGEAALFLSLNPDCVVDDGGECGGINNAHSRIDNASNLLNTINKNTITTGSGTIGSPIYVEISTSYELITPIIPATSLTLTAKANQTVVVNQ